MYYRVFSAWRLIAALMILIYHFVHYGPEGREAVIARLELMMAMLDMFFMMSGFLIFVHYRDLIDTAAGYRAYIVRRFARIYPLQIATMAFFVAVAIAGYFGLVSTGGASRYDLTQVAPNLLLVQAWGFSRELSLNYVSWSLSAEWFCYLFLPVLVFASRWRGPLGLFVLLALWLITLEALTAAGAVPFKSWMVADTWGAWRAFADFVAGACVAGAVERTRWRLRAQWPSWAVVILALAAMQLRLPSYLCFALVLVAIYLAALAETNAPECSRWLAPLDPVAKVSFGIYMWHPVIETIIYVILWPRIAPHLPPAAFYMALIASMAATVVWALLSARYFEKPAGQWITRKLASRRREPAPAAE